MKIFMNKKFIALGLAFLMLFSLMAFVGCDVTFDSSTDVTTDTSPETYVLEEVKAVALLALQEHVNALRESYYSAENWSKVQSYLADGILAINAAENRAGVDAALITAKQAITFVEPRLVWAEDMVEFIIPYWHPPSGSFSGGDWWGIHFTLNHLAENVIFEVAINKTPFRSGNSFILSKGLLFVYEVGMFIPSIEQVYQIGYSKIVNSDDTVVWGPGEVGNTEVVPIWTSDPSLFSLAFINIIVRVGEQIVGYAVVGIIQMPLGSNITAGVDNAHGFVLASYLFPKVNGEYQDITEEYVQEAIAKVVG